MPAIEDEGKQINPHKPGPLIVLERLAARSSPFNLLTVHYMISTEDSQPAPVRPGAKTSLLLTKLLKQRLVSQDELRQMIQHGLQVRDALSPMLSMTNQKNLGYVISLAFAM